MGRVSAARTTPVCSLLAGASLLAAAAIASASLFAAGRQVAQRPAEPHAGPPSAIAAAPPSRRNASYVIRARLDPATRTITGDEVLTWRNIAAVPAATLQFHLYYNAWRNTQSTWMRERLLAGDTVTARRPEEDWGWIDVTSVRVGDADLTPKARFISPDDGNPDDRTVLEVPLDASVPPGGTIAVSIAWTSRVPRT